MYTPANPWAVISLSFTRFHWVVSMYTPTLLLSMVLSTITAREAPTQGRELHMLTPYAEFADIVLPTIVGAEFSPWIPSLLFEIVESRITGCSVRHKVKGFEPGSSEPIPTNLCPAPARFPSILNSNVIHSLPSRMSKPPS